MRRCLVLGMIWAAAGPCFGEQQQPDEKPEAEVLTALDKQRAAARLQAGVRDAGRESFFLVPFSFPAPVVPPFFTPASCTPASKEQIGKWIAEAATKEGVARNVIEAVVEVESAYDSCAVSPKGAEGLMQLMPAVQEELDVSDPFDARQNLFAGVRHLKRLLDDYKGDLKSALSAYNAGAARVQESGGVPPLAETQDYVARILEKLKASPAPPPGASGASPPRPPPARR
jgi:soluble lytic murein transglycosylase-like protein